MRRLALAALVLVACKKAPTATVSTADADALWAYAPEQLAYGLVYTPRALTMLESAALDVQTFVKTVPELAEARPQVLAAIEAQLGGPFTALADLGIDHSKGFAVFATKNHDMLVVLPVGDRTKLVKLGIDTQDPNKLGNLVCKPLNNTVVCASNDALFASVGKGTLPRAIRTVGVRGDVEVMLSDPAEIAIVGQLTTGAFIVHGTATVPPFVTSKLTGAAAPRIVANTTAAFAVASVAAVTEMLPDFLVGDGSPIGAILASLAGPLTVTIPGGGLVPDVHLPLHDPAPITALLASCSTVLPPEMLAPQQPADGCRIIVPTYNAPVEIWTSGKELRAGVRGTPPTPTPVSLSPLGEELANGQWVLGLWGRGSIVSGAPLVMVGMPESQGAMMTRAMTMLSEAGFGLRVDGTLLRFVVGIRSQWANPPALVAKLAAIPTAQLMSTDRTAFEALARSAPSSPFAQDYAAGQGGLMIPTGLLGVAAAVAIPAVMDYVQKSKQPEAARLLDRIGKNAKLAYATNGAFPTGKSSMTDKACCTYPDRKCETTMATWQQAPWSDLAFSVDEPTLFRYSYESADGQTFVARAIGDLDCDGTEVTYTLTGATQQGTPTVVLEAPAPNTD